MPAPQPLCAIDLRHPARTGRLCFRHRDSLGDLLDPSQEGTRYDIERPDDPQILPSIPVLLATLDTEPRYSSIGVPGSNPPSSRPPADLDAIAAQDPRSRMLGLVEPERPPLVVLRALARRVGAPEWTDPYSLCSGLHARLDHLTRQEWVAEAWHELRALHARLRAQHGDHGVKPLGPCTQLVDDDGVLLSSTDPRIPLLRPGHTIPGVWTCATRLRMPDLPPRGPDDPPVLPTVRCRGCGYAYTGAELVALGAELARQEAS